MGVSLDLDCKEDRQRSASWDVLQHTIAAGTASGLVFELSCIRVQGSSVAKRVIVNTRWRNPPLAYSHNHSSPNLKAFRFVLVVVQYAFPGLNSTARVLPNKAKPPGVLVDTVPCVVVSSSEANHLRYRYHTTRPTHWLSPWQLPLRVLLSWTEALRILHDTAKLAYSALMFLV
jgi:hypothetical protein